MDKVLESPPELSLDIEDKKLVEYVKSYIKQAEKKEGELRIKERRKINRRFFFGNQIDVENRVYKGLTEERSLKRYEKPFIDNAIKEGEDILRPILLSRMPDLIVNPGNPDNEFSVASAEQITDVVNNALTSREMRKLLTKVSRNHPLDFIGVIKWRWDVQKGRFGDVVFEPIPADDILMDYTATENNEREMSIVVHYVTKSLKKWILMFPDKEEILKKYAENKGKIGKGKYDEEALAARLRLPEVWFEWSERENTPENDEEEAEVQPEPQEEDQDEMEEKEDKIKTTIGVMWMCGDDVLDKRQNPNWDYEGQEEYFYEGQPVPDEVLEQMVATGIQVPGLQIEKTYKNFFGRPRKPFIFMGYEQYGRLPIDETSRVEENITIQENYDNRNMRVTKMIDDAQGKNVWSGMSGLKRETVEEQDFNNPDEDFFVEGKVSDVHAYIKKEQPSAQMFNDLVRSHDRILSKLHVHGATRGEVQSDTATTNQIARESDFTVIDDMAENLINDVATQMGEVLLHMMKLRYTENHFKAVLGKKGEQTFFRFKNDMIEDGMEVAILASGTDKLKAERNAKEEAQLGLIDPLSYYEAIGHKDAEKRAERLFLMQTAPELYYEKFIKGNDVPDIAEKIALANQQRLQQAGVQPQGQGVPTNPQNPTPGNTQAVPTSPPNQPAQGSPRNLMSSAGQAIQGGINRVMGR